MAVWGHQGVSGYRWQWMERNLWGQSRGLVCVGWGSHSIWGPSSALSRVLRNLYGQVAE